MSILARITSDDLLDTTYEWLCRTHSYSFAIIAIGTRSVRLWPTEVSNFAQTTLVHASKLFIARRGAACITLLARVDEVIE